MSKKTAMGTLPDEPARSGFVRTGAGAGLAAVAGGSAAAGADPSAKISAAEWAPGSAGQRYGALSSVTMCRKAAFRHVTNPRYCLRHDYAGSPTYDVAEAVDRYEPPLLVERRNALRHAELGVATDLPLRK